MPRDARGNLFLATEVLNDFLTIIGAPLQRNGRAVKIAVKNRILTTLAFCARGSNIFLTTQLLRLKFLTASSWAQKKRACVWGAQLPGPAPRRNRGWGSGLVVGGTRR